MNEQIERAETVPAPSVPRTYHNHEYRLVSLRECNERTQPLADTPEGAADYARRWCLTSPQHRPEVECLWVLLINTRRRIKGHVFVSMGNLDTILVHAREVFRPAIVGNAAAVIILHNHPSGDPQPSEGDIKVTRELIRGGQCLRIEVLDHIILGSEAPGARNYCSLREIGYFSF